MLHLADHDPNGIDMTRDNRKRLALYARAEIEMRIQFPTIGGAEFAHIFGVALDPTLIADLRVSLSLAKLGGGLWSGQVGRTIKLPSDVATTYEATKQLNAEDPMRSFTPDVHLVGHLGEVIAAKEFKLTVLANSYPGHDAKDKTGRYVQITRFRSMKIVTGLSSCKLYRLNTPN